jgi:tetratricopeptide (TPR) repeat protein
VLVEEPPAPVPVHPAPLALLDLIQSMLVRDAAARPDLAEVIESFERQLATADPAPPDVGSDVVIEAPLPAAVATMPVKKRGRGAGAAWWLVAAAAAGVAALLWLPKPGPEIAAAVAPAAPLKEVERVADAVVPEVPVATPVAVSPPAPAGTPVSLEDELRAGRAALDALQPALARAAFQRALLLQADLPEALKGLASAARIDTLLASLAEASRMEARGELAGAADRYRLLLANAQQFTPARNGLDRVSLRLREQRFEDLLATGADALRRGRIPVAQSAYRQAADIHPEDARVRDGQQRIAEVMESQRNATDLATGAALEEAERWDDALAHYRQVVARDASLRFAQDGVTRSERRAALDRELRDYIARPERLSAPAVRKAAQQALARGESSISGAPRLQEQVQQLDKLLQALQVHVQVAIVSDDSTRVSLAPLGDLGAFRSRELRLPPGHYTVIGRRDGFRDVRYEFEIGPGRVTPTLSVQCTERI